MDIKKVFARAAGSTIAAIVILLSVMLLALSFLFPYTMMEMTYKLGMDRASYRNAKRAYAMYGKDVYYIAYATEVAIGMDDEKRINESGEKLIADEEFSAYCEKRDGETASEGGYKQYVYSQLCLAKYELGKKGEAVEKAFALLAGAFPTNNALAALGMRALIEGDKETATAVQTKMNEIDTAALSDVDEAFYGKISAVLENGLNG